MGKKKRGQKSRHWIREETVEPIPIPPLNRLIDLRTLGMKYKIDRSLEEIRLRDFCLVGHQQNHREYAVKCLDLSQSNYLLAGSAGGVVDISTLRDSEPSMPVQQEVDPELLSQNSVRLHEKQVTGCQWYPHDLQKFVTADSSGKDGPSLLKISDTSTMRCVYDVCFDGPLQFHWGPSSPLIAVADYSRHIKLVDARIGHYVFEIQCRGAPVISARWHPSEYTLATGNRDGYIRLWDTRMCRKYLASNMSYLGKQPIGGLRFTSDGNRLVSVSTGLSVSIWNSWPLEEEMFHRQMSGLAGPCDEGYSRFIKTSPQIKHFLPSQVRFDVCDEGDGLRVAVPFGPETQWIHFRTDGLVVPEILKDAGHPEIVSSCCYRPKYQQLLTSANGADKSVLIWSTKSDKVSREAVEKETRRRNLKRAWADIMEE